MTWGAGFEPSRANRRGYVARMALFYGFWALLSGALVATALFKMFTDDSGYIIMFLVFSPVFLLTGYQAKQFVRDMRTEPVVSEGEVSRKWDKSNPLELPMLFLIVGTPLAVVKFVTSADFSVALWLVYIGVGVLFAWKVAMPLVRELITVASSEGKGVAKLAGSTLGFFFLPSFYMVVDQKIFCVASEDFLHLLETDLVRITHFPHSLTIEQLERYDPNEKQYIRPDGASV